MKLHILGTGNGSALDCYNTCFAIENNGEYLLVDGGGGNQILKQLNLANIDILNIHNVFLSHNHSDHILGVVWVLRGVCQQMRFEDIYQGNLNIYGSDESMSALKMLIEMLFPTAKKFMHRIIFNVVEDGQVVRIANMNVKFFDIKARKDKQFAFTIEDKLAFCGDEPLTKDLFDLAKNKEWLIHESFCLDHEESTFNARKKGHCTVKEASQTAKELNVKNLILVHTQDNDLLNRKKLYTSEARTYFDGNIFIPDDLEVIDI